MNNYTTSTNPDAQRDTLLADLIKKVQHGDGARVHAVLKRRGIVLSHYSVTQTLKGKAAFNADVWDAFTEVYNARMKKQIAALSAITEKLISATPNAAEL